MSLGRTLCSAHNPAAIPTTSPIIPVVLITRNKNRRRKKETPPKDVSIYIALSWEEQLKTVAAHEVKLITY
jgi:hypothetical protein